MNSSQITLRIFTYATRKLPNSSRNHPRLNLLSQLYPCPQRSLHISHTIRKLTHFLKTKRRVTMFQSLSKNSLGIQGGNIRPTTLTSHRNSIRIFRSWISMRNPSPHLIIIWQWTQVHRIGRMNLPWLIKHRNKEKPISATKKITTGIRCRNSSSRTWINWRLGR